MTSSKNNFLLAATLLVLLLIPAQDGLARQEKSRVTLRTGIISGSSVDASRFQFAPYPELEVSTRFKTGSAWSVSGAAYAGYS